MLVHNVRLGFATNSSSTHSIIFLKPKQRVIDADIDGHEYGWNYWTAASTAAKRQYLAIQLFQALTSQVNKDVAEAVCDAWVKDHEKGGDCGCFGGPTGSVDHQSQYVLPVSWDGKGVDKEFFDEFAAFFMRDDVVLLGGNDNDEETHPLADNGAFVLPLPRDGHSTSLVARKDTKHGFWTVFDRETGAKVRFSFDDPSTKREVVKATTPELVDVKITDFCPFGCAFCYQGSTHGGKHADVSTLNSLAYAFQRMKVFEVAIGGGEPTMHPKFVEIIQAFKMYGVVPNFTTKNLTWLRDPAVWPKVIEAIGGFAFSADKAEDVKKLASLLEVNNIDTAKANVQYVMGSGSLYDLEQIIRTAAEHHLRITLLGFKTTGRGATFKPQDYKGWTKVITKLNAEKVYFNLGIDTALARESPAELAKAKVHPTLYETHEGLFSMYLDAVDMKLAPSSYVEDIAMKRVKSFDENTILENFAGWGKTSWEKLDALDAE
jgi:Radical SAM superfamily